MGKKAAEYYEKAKEIGGVTAKIRLIALTKMTTGQAEEAPDTTELIQVFNTALNTLRKEYRSQQANGNTPKSIIFSNNSSNHFNSAYLYLKGQLPQLKKNPREALRKITESTANVLNIERSGIWFFDEMRSMIKCVDLYSRKTMEHTSGMVLMAEDFPVYFRSLLYERTIAADDANTDPRTIAFSEPYLKPLRITSMLDVPIWNKGKMQGILCSEHTITKRKWKVEEEEFAYNMASIVALCIGNSEHRY